MMKMKEFEARSFEHKGKTFEKIIDHEWIAEACDNIISIIKKRRSYTKTLFVSLLNGSVPFEEELSSKATRKMDIMRISYHSYSGTKSTGKFNIEVPIDVDRVKGRDVIILEDIIDTGLTMQKVIADLKAAGAKSVKIVCVLDKVGKHPDLPILYSAFNIKDKFVVGYGMDFDGEFRDIPHIYATGLAKDEELVL